MGVVLIVVTYLVDKVKVIEGIAKEQRDKMIYVMSDIHGEYKAYRDLLNQMQFCVNFEYIFIDISRDVRKLL